MLLEIKVVLLAEAQLQEVIIERFLAHAYFRGCVFERVPDEVAFAQHSIIEPSPQTDFLDDLLDGSFFCALSFIFSFALRLFVVIFGTASRFPTTAAGRWRFVILGDSLLAARAYIRVAALLLFHAS